jgi:type IV fimbrial biogenesis protein FimT
MPAMKSLWVKGFTMIELMVTLSVAAILITLVVPNMREFIRNNRLTSAANDALRGIQQARSEAVKRQQGNVVMCATADAEAADAAITCSYGDFTGWFVFSDLNNNGQRDGAEAVILKSAAHPAVTVQSDNGGIFCFMPTGFEDVNCGGNAKTQNIVLCDQRGITAIGNRSTARALLITPTGRARVTSTNAEIVATGIGCP